MYKVIIVDDEEIILESIKYMIEWEQYGLTLVATASNGIEAYEKISQLRPNIVITDVKMPGMNGLELVAKVKEMLPETIFLILSGYGEFEFASKAMSLGVKNYLLKPCDEQEFIEAMNKCVDEIKQEEEKKNQYVEIKQKVKQILPYAKQELLRDFIASNAFKTGTYDFFSNLFELPKGKFQILLFKSNSKWDNIDRYALQNIVEECLEIDHVYMTTTIEDKMLIAIPIMKKISLKDKLKKVRSVFAMYFEIELYIAIGEKNKFEEIVDSYEKMDEGLEYSFYLGDQKILDENSVNELMDKSNVSIEINHDDVIFAIKERKELKMEQALSNFFKELRSKKENLLLHRYFCMELLLTVIRQCDLEEGHMYARKVTVITNMENMQQIQTYTVNVCREIIQTKNIASKSNTNIIVERIISYVNKNIAKQELSLSSIAQNVLFMNENYVGRLFYKETQEKFSHYLTRIRINKAKELLRLHPEYKNYEICERIGFAEDTQYFGQVFKKYTGYTLTEYRKIIE